MNACILAVGSEMLTPFRVDTNSLFITERLNEIGYDVRLKAVVADHVDELVRVLEGALSWADVIVVTGGLGPTEDDITRDAVARVLDAPMAIDDRIVSKLAERFARRGMKMSDNNRRQAMVPRGAEIIENANGTAPGLWLTRGRTSIALLPGPPLSSPHVCCSACQKPASRIPGFFASIDRPEHPVFPSTNSTRFQLAPPSVVLKTPRSSCGPVMRPCAQT